MNDILDFIENSERHRVMITEILENNLIMIRPIQLKYGKLFGKESTPYQYIRKYLTDFRIKGILRLMDVGNLTYKLNENWREVLQDILKILNEIPKKIRKAKANEVIKNGKNT